MRRNTQNTDYRYYAYIPSPNSTSSSSRNSHYQYYDRRFRIQRRPPILQPLPQTNLSDLSEPISIFDELIPSVHHRSSISPLPSIYISPNASRPSSISDVRLATANAERRRLLTDIQHTISEIDHELSSFERQRSAARYVPSRLTPIAELNAKLPILRKTPLPIDQNQLWPSKPKRVYKVIPRLASAAKETIQQSPITIPYEVSTLTLTDNISSHSFVGQYHYGPETEEIEILENDPENSERTSMIKEIPELTSYEIFSTSQFLRQQSTLSQHRAMIFVPEYSGGSDVGMNEFSEDFPQNDPFITSTARSSTASSFHDFGSSNKLSIQDFQLLAQTAPERKKSDKVELDLINQNNPMLSKPVKHARQSLNIQEKPTSIQQTIPKEDHTSDNSAYFFSDFGHEGEGEEDCISIDPSNFILPFESEITPDDNLIEQFQPSVPSPHSIQMSQQQQQPTIENHNEQRKETESKRIDATTKHNVIVATSTLPSSSSPRSQQVVPISITDNMQTQFARKNKDKDQPRTSKTKLNINTNEQLQEEMNRLNNLQIRLYSPSTQSTTKQTNQQIENMSTTSTERQRSASLHHSVKTNEKNQSIKENEHVIDNKQTSRVSSTANSPLPVPLTSPDFNNDRLSSSRATTPEKRNSIASEDLNIVLTTADIIDFEDPSLITSTNHLQAASSPPLNTQRDEPSPLEEFPTRIQHHSKSDEPELPPMSPEIKVDHPSISPSNNKQEEHAQQSVLIPDLTNSHEKEEEEENNRLKSVSPIDVETKKDEHENSSSKFEYDDLRLPSISPHHSEVSDENLTSVDREDTYRQQISPDHNNNHDQIIEKPTSPSPEPKLIPENERHPSAKKSASSTHSKHEEPRSSSSPPSIVEEGSPSITASQKRSKLSLLVRQKKTKRKKSINDQSVSQTDTENLPLMNNDEKSEQQQRHVLFSTDIAHFQTTDDPDLKNWRKRVDVILEKKRFHNDKYSHIQSRVNSFANFEYRPRTFITSPKKKSGEKETDTEERKSKNQSEQQLVSVVKKQAPQLFGRLWREPDGRPRIFSESLHWDVESKLKAYSLENLHHQPHKSDLKIFDKKPKWHSESKLAELIKGTPYHQTVSLPAISDKEESTFHHKESEIERKIFDIHSNDPQSTSIFQQSFVYNVSYKSYGSKPSEKPIFDEKLLWKKKSKLKDSTWGNINYQPKKSNIQIFHKSVHWNSEPKIRSRSLSTTRISLNHSQIFHEKLNWDTKAKIQYWSEVDLRQIAKHKALFAQYYDSKWSDIISTDVDGRDNNYPRRFSKRTMWKEESKMKHSVEENSKLEDQTSPESDDRRHLQGVEQENEEMASDLQFSNVFLSQFRRVSSPANRPKWNSVSKTRSVNSVYNPKIPNSNSIRKGWDFELRRRRIHKLPPLKRKRDHDEIPRLALEQPSSTERFAIDYNYDHSLPTHDRAASIDYATISSRRSSKVLPALKRLPELQLSSETPRSHRPVQQEWYDESSKSRLTHRTDMGRIGNNSYRESIGSIQQRHTPRELLTLRSSTRNSQNSVVSGTLLDSSIRTNRATELRLSRDMDEHHQHSHTPSQSMPIEIRGFKLEGTQLLVPDNATIRPLSNVSYRASERIKRHRIYPWSTLHSHGTSSRNSPLVPIAEFRHPSFSTTIIEGPHMVHEE